MKKINLNLGALMAIGAFFCLFFGAFIEGATAIPYKLIEKTATSLIIAYLAFRMSFLETKKVGLFFLPLLTHSLIILLGLGRLKAGGLSEIFTLVTSLYRLLLILGYLFLVEFLLNKVIGSKATSVLGLISLLVYLGLFYKKSQESFKEAYDMFLYFAFYVMAIRIRPATRVSPLLIGLSILGFILEAYFYDRLPNYGLFISAFPLSYLSLKTVKENESPAFRDYFLTSLIYTYPSLSVFIKAYLGFDLLATMIIAILASYILADLIYRLNIKNLSYIVLGIY